VKGLDLWMIPAGVPGRRELAPRGGLTGMQISGNDGIRASRTRFPAAYPLRHDPVISFAAGVTDPVRYARRTRAAASAIQGDPVRSG
jgi:hypothetical protein